MNKGKVCFDLALILLGLLVISFFGFFIYMSYNAGEDTFCRKNGYDYAPYYGEYKDYKNVDYGRINCKKEYAEGDEHKIFNVTYNRWEVFTLVSGEKDE